MKRQLIVISACCVLGLGSMAYARATNADPRSKISALSEIGGIVGGACDCETSETECGSCTGQINCDGNSASPFILDCFSGEKCGKPGSGTQN